MFFHYFLCACSVAQSSPTVCDPGDSSLPGSFIHGIFQARILQWVTISFCRGSSWPWDWTFVSCISCIGRWVLYHWAVENGLLSSWETLFKYRALKNKVSVERPGRYHLSHRMKAKLVAMVGIDCHLIGWNEKHTASFLCCFNLIVKKISE